MLFAVNNLSFYENSEEIILANNIKDAVNKNLDVFARKLAKKAIETNDFLSLSEEITKIKSEIIAPALENVVQYQIDKFEKNANIPNKCKNHGKKERKIASNHGEINISRTIIYDPSQKKCAYPAEIHLGIIPDKNQMDIKKAVEKLSIELPYAEAAKIINEITGLNLSIGSIHNITTDIGESATEKNVLPTKEEVLNKINDAMKKHKNENPILVTAFDGAFEPTRAEESKRKGFRGKGEWKEAKGFRVYLSFNKDIYQIASWHQIGTDEELSKVLDVLVENLKYCNLEQVSVADGAKWIWKLVERHFPKSIEILDYYHFSEHLSRFCEIQYGKGTAEAIKWINKCKKWVFSSKAESIRLSLQRISYKNNEAEKCALNLMNYIENNLHRLDYAKFQMLNFPIGSGGMESANKFICHVRLKRSGCWWKPSHANEILKLRCGKFNNKTEDILESYKNNALKEQREILENNENGMKKMIASKKSHLVCLSGGQK